MWGIEVSSEARKARTGEEQKEKEEEKHGYKFWVMRGERKGKGMKEPEIQGKYDEIRQLKRKD